MLFSSCRLAIVLHGYMEIATCLVFGCHGHPGVAIHVTLEPGGSACSRSLELSRNTSPTTTMLPGTEGGMLPCSTAAVKSDPVGRFHPTYFHSYLMPGLDLQGVSIFIAPKSRDSGCPLTTPTGGPGYGDGFRDILDALSRFNCI